VLGDEACKSARPLTVDKDSCTSAAYPLVLESEKTFYVLDTTSNVAQV